MFTIVQWAPGKNLFPHQTTTIGNQKFGGDITEWQTFWDQFKAAVDNTTLPKVNKFTYLKNLFGGESLNINCGANTY